jgi:two-component system, OmpR family, phosphate regulon sensor histidine kinase PhoR
MIRLSRVWKFYIISTSVFVILVTIAGFVLQTQLKKKLKAQLEERVFTMAHVLARVLPETADPAMVSQWCRQYGEAAEVRITVIAEDGRVVGDSSEDAIVGENHLDRPEIRRAIAMGTATAVRSSETLGVDMFYAAVSFEEKGIIIRLALPMTEVNTIENEVMIFLMLTLYLIPILAIIISFLFTRVVASESPGFTRSSRLRHAHE